MTEVGAAVAIVNEAGRTGVVLEYRDDADAVRVAIDGSPVVRWYAADQLAIAS